MTSRERLTRLFNKQEIDRIPIWLLYPFHRLGCYADVYNSPTYNPIMDRIEQGDCDTFDRRGYDCGFCFNNNSDVKFSSFSEQDGGNIRNGRRITYKDYVWEAYISRGNDTTKQKFFVSEADELKKLLEIPYKPNFPDISKYAEEKEELGERGLMMTDIGDPLQIIYNLMSAEDFSMMTLTDYDVLTEFLDIMRQRVLDKYRYLLENNIGEVIFLVGAEFAGPPIVSPLKFNELVVRYVKEIVDLIRSYGKKSILHYHGNLFKVLDGMKEINPDGLHTIEAPPIGDCTITQARNILGDMILIGNMQYDTFRSASTDEIREEIKQIIEEGKSGRFILSPTAGPYEPSLDEHMVESYLAFIDAGLEFGKLK